MLYAGSALSIGLDEAKEWLDPICGSNEMHETDS